MQTVCQIDVLHCVRPEAALDLTAFPFLQGGVNDADVAREIPGSTTEQRAAAFNSLLSSARIQLVGPDYDNPRYRALAHEEAAK